MSENSNAKNLTYQSSGVNIDEGNRFVEEIKPLIKKTRQPNALSNLGGFAGLFAIDLKQYPNPVMVACTDGVGTKLKLAIRLNRYEEVGVDVVAMCVNDMICCGAKPEIFLDYLATSKLDTDQIIGVMKGMTTALSSIHCELLGGETAEMPGMYHPNDFDIAGFSVGLVNKDQIIDGQHTQSGDVIIGIESSGIHSNGFSLVRKVLEVNEIQLDQMIDGFDQPIGEILLTPTELYVNPILSLIKQVKVKTMAHITGGGLIENLPRVFSHQLKAVIDKKEIPTLPIFHWLQKMGNISSNEMYRVFNMGVGFAVIVEKSDVEKSIEIIKQHHLNAKVIGEIKNKENHHQTSVELI